MATKKPAPKKPTTKAKSRKVNWKKAAVELASCAIWALKFMQTPHKGPGMGIILSGPNRGKTFRWEDKFMDALDLVGYKVDRKAYYAKGKKRGR